MSDEIDYKADEKWVQDRVQDAEIYINVTTNGSFAVGSPTLGVTISAAKWTRAEAWADARNRLEYPEPQSAPVSKEVSAEKFCASCNHSKQDHQPWEDGCRRAVSICPMRKCPCERFVETPPTLPPMDGKGTELPDRPAIHKSEAYSETSRTYEWTWAYEEDVTEYGDEMERQLNETRAALQQAGQQRDAMQAERDRAEQQRDREYMMVERMKAERDQALAAEAWIEIKEGCEMPKPMEKVCVWTGHHWYEERYLPDAPYSLGVRNTHWRRITPPAGVP